MALLYSALKYLRRICKICLLGGWNIPFRRYYQLPPASCHHDVIISDRDGGGPRRIRHSARVTSRHLRKFLTSLQCVIAGITVFSGQPADRPVAGTGISKGLGPGQPGTDLYWELTGQLGRCGGNARFWLCASPRSASHVTSKHEMSRRSTRRYGQSPNSMRHHTLPSKLN